MNLVLTLGNQEEAETATMVVSVQCLEAWMSVIQVPEEVSKLVEVVLFSGKGFLYLEGLEKFQVFLASLVGSLLLGMEFRFSSIPVLIVTFLEAQVCQPPASSFFLNCKHEIGSGFFKIIKKILLSKWVLFMLKKMS